MLLITFQVLNTEVSGPKVNSAGGRGLCPRLIWATKFCETPEKDTPSLLREPQKHVPFSPGMKEGPSHRLDPVRHAKLRASEAQQRGPGARHCTTTPDSRPAPSFPTREPTHTSSAPGACLTSGPKLLKWTARLCPDRGHVASRVLERRDRHTFSVEAQKVNTVGSVGQSSSARSLSGSQGQM